MILPVIRFYFVQCYLRDLQFARNGSKLSKWSIKVSKMLFNTSCKQLSLMSLFECFILHFISAANLNSHGEITLLEEGQCDVKSAEMLFTETDSERGNISLSQ